MLEKYSLLFWGCECFFLRVTKVWTYYKVPVAQYRRSASALKPLQNGTPVQDHAAMPPPIAASIPTRKDEVAPSDPLISEAKVTPKVDLVPQQSMLENANLLDQELQEAKDSACCPAKPKAPKKETKARSKKQPAVKVQKVCGKKQQPGKKSSTKESRDKEHYQNLLAAGVPLMKALRQKSSGCAGCRNRKWCTRSCWISRGFKI